LSPAHNLQVITTIMFMGVLCTCTKLCVTDLQILGCELHQNAFGGRAPPGPDGGAIAFPRFLSAIRERDGGGEGKGSE